MRLQDALEGVCTIKLNKHDQHVQDLCSRLSGYDSVLSHVQFHSRKNRLVAEADILACRGNTCDIFEVKCSHRIVKARQQLQKLKRHISEHENYVVGNLFFYCGDSGMIFTV